MKKVRSSKKALEIFVTFQASFNLISLVALAFLIDEPLSPSAV